MQKKTSKKTISIKPLGDRVLVRPYSKEDLEKAQGKKSYGILLPEDMKNEKSAQGLVLAVGEGKIQDGKLIPVRVKVGDTVIFSRYTYDEVEQNGEDLYLLKEDNILAVIQ